MKLICTCESEMEMVEQDMTNNKVVQLKYKCKCGNTGLVLEHPNNSYDLYIKDPAGKLLRYDTGVEE